MITFKSVGAQEMFLRDLNPLIAIFNIFIEKPPNDIFYIKSTGV